MQNQSIANFFSQVDELTQTHLKLEDVPTVVVMGTYNSGKSTLVNNLLGQRLSPVDIIPTTPAPVRFSYGERFLARVYYHDRQMHILTAGELARLLTRKVQPGGEITHVEVRYKHDLLNKMHIVDTPGIDALHEPSSLLSRFPAPDHIVYLLQQRGLNEADRQQVQKLVDSYPPGIISFWINCNLGAHDGTSLEESRRYLRQICGSEVTVYLTNTINHEDIHKFELFIENQAAILKMQKISDKLEKLDVQISDMLTASMRENDDAKFLEQLWPAIEQARLIIHGQNMINTLPPVSQQIASLLDKPASPAGAPGGISLVYKTAGPRKDPAATREKILSIVEQALADPSLIPYTDSIKKLESLHSQLKKENYLVTAAGGFSSGKSTFFNALMGETILPVQNRPTTFAITLLKHGNPKKATINYSRQVTIPTHYVEGQQAIICRHELSALERWVTDPELTAQIYAIEKSKNGRSTKITITELLQQIELVKKSFARVKRDFTNKRRPWQSLFKKIAAQNFMASELADYFSVYFKNAAKQEIELDSPAGRAELAEIASSHLALRVSDIVIEHPAEPLRLATFVDTPGLDSIYHHHREITTRYLPSSDCFLFFLNGKHILTQPDMGIWEMLSQAMQDRQQPSHKLFFLINFADTLAINERNKVNNYLQENLVKPSQGAVDQSNLYYISALDALTGRDKTNFSRFMGHLKERIWELRCADNYREFIQIFKQALPRAVQPETNSDYKEVDKQLALLKSETADLLESIKQRMVYWQAQIASFSSQEDFCGLRKGQKSIKKGFLGLSRKAVTVHSCHDLSDSVNSLLNNFDRKWAGHKNNLYLLNTTELQKTIDNLPANFKLSQAHSVLSKYIGAQEERVISSINTMADQIEHNLKLNAPKSKNYHISPAALAAAQRYIKEINKLEENIYGTSQP